MYPIVAGVLPWFIMRTAILVAAPAEVSLKA
jgi:hypothetical protein